MGLLPDFRNNEVVGYLGVKLDLFPWLALVTNEASLTAVEDIKAMGNMNFGILSLNPGELINDLVAPLIETLVADVHL